MRRHVDAVSQTADNRHVRHFLRQLLDQFAAQLLASVRGITRAHHRDELAVVRSQITFSVEQQRTIGALRQPLRVVVVLVVIGLQVMFLDELQFAVSPTECFPYALQRMVVLQRRFR